MLPFHKMLERAFTGPVCSEHDFDMKILLPNLRKVVKKYGIKYDRTQPVPADDDLADRVWQAGLEFLEETGLFCPDTERRILFTRKEIDAALAVGARGKVVGASHDTRTIPRRFPEDRTPPFCSVGGVSVPMSTEANFISVVRAIGQNPLADGVANPSMTHVDGQLIVAASPLEVEGAIRGMIMAREGLRRAGRPDLAILNACPAAAKAAGHIAGHRFGIGKGDALEIGTTAEMRIDFDSLNKIAFSLSTGSLVFGENGVILGGLAGGPEGTAVLTAAYNPVDILVLRACCQHPFPTHFDLRTTSTRDTIWARSVGNQAVSRNSIMPLVNVGYCGAGPNTKMAFYESAAWPLATVVSGGSVEVTALGRGVSVDHTGPLEPLFSTQVCHAVVGMSRKEANGIVVKLLEKYEDGLRDPPLGARYQDCCDVDSSTPNKEYLDLYWEMCQEFEEAFGLHLPQVCPYS